MLWKFKALLTISAISCVSAVGVVYNLVVQTLKAPPLPAPPLPHLPQAPGDASAELMQLSDRLVGALSYPPCTNSAVKFSSPVSFHKFPHLKNNLREAEERYYIATLPTTSAHASKFLSYHYSAW